MPLPADLPNGLPNGVQPTPEPIPHAPGQGGQIAVRQQIATLREAVRNGELRFTPSASAAPAAPAVAPAPAAAVPAAPADPAQPAPAAPTPETPAQGADPGLTPDGEPLPDGEIPPGEEGIERVALRLAGRNPGEEVEVEIETDDPQIAQALRQNRNEGMRREEFNRQMERVRQREDTLAYVDTFIQTDPAGFIMSRLPADQRTRVVEVLLADPEVYNAVQQRLDEYSDPNTRETARLRHENESMRRQQNLDATLEARREQNRAVQAIEETVDSVVSVFGNDRQRRDFFVEDAMTDLQRHYERTQRDTAMTPQEIVTVLRPRLQMYGVSEAQIAQVVNGGRPAPIPAATPDAAAAARLRDDASATSRRFVRASQARRAAAVAGTAGAPAAATPMAPPAGQTVKDRVNWVRERFGIPKK